ncbi:probable bifunctional protein related to glutathione S-transferase/ probable histidinol dehydrogenase [Melanopsichium pennsylvanicum]|uniref:1-(5-phosphoribosyl)-5-[(5-phosphoribosylamino)methylideneamino] imidazole-4-carboxamide isomerase n=2 Tax=Melanopsichium pennsylvanicum TaxID=63383 RepID=A0AAJ5C8H0_9BASI|nr:probable bifunctional protein (related to glutathione S-transferase/ probable histidinol dehydrogenase [Melanopsichium pennsylvanicum 4]SNX87976.1 probable bifunctional protein related to glutathione S-transferase/ probable histidinol dehydrogenase [Melanopsichium pennsylvanicum]
MNGTPPSPDAGGPDAGSGLVLHHLELSRSNRVLFLLEELQIPYQIKVYKRDPVTRLAGPDLKAVHPLGRSPVLTDGGLTIIETNAIIDHLMKHYYDPSRVNLGPKLGEKTQESIDVGSWIQFAEASIMLHGIPLFYLIKGGSDTEDASSTTEKVCARGIKADLDYIEESLEKNAGMLVRGWEFTAADCAMLYSVDMIGHIFATRSEQWRKNLGLEIRSATREWMQRCFQRPAFKRAVAKEAPSQDQESSSWLEAFFGSQQKSKQKQKEQRKSVFRPCIDLHEGVVKQIVGGTLTDSDSTLRTNFVSTHTPSYYASLYCQHNLRGGHVIKLGPRNDEAATAAVAAWSKGLHVGGGITLDNAQEWLDRGAEKVIVTSYLFPSCRFSLERLKELSEKVGKENLVVDVSCRKRGDKWVVAMNRWQDMTDMEVDKSSLDLLAKYCSEFLIHAADVEGLCQGIDTELVARLAEWVTVPTTYAGGARNLGDLELVDKLSDGRVDLTFGSALDIFGGKGVTLDELVAWNKSAETK